MNLAPNTSIYSLTDSLASLLQEPPPQRIDYVQKPRQIDLTQFTAQELAWIDEADEEQD